MSGKVKAKIELPDLTSAINSATVEVMGLFRAETLEMIDTEIWRGFKYSGNYPLEQKGTSGESWNSTELIKSDTGFTYGFQLYNNAQVQPRAGTKRNGQPYSTNSVGNFYAAYVQKSTDSEPLEKKVIEQIKTQLLPDLEIALLKTIQEKADSSIAPIELRADDGSIGTYDFNL
tara:strand:+ start:329 stop:850 length:522 start_codon:yes stop_codon:yes gene_type:complete